MHSILGLWTVASPAGVDVSWNTVSNALVIKARNDLVARFLRSEATHLLFIDADIGFAPEQVLDMLRFDQTFVAGVYPHKTYPVSLVGQAAQPCEGKGRFITGEYAGCGLMLLKREVIECMIASYPEARYGVCKEYYALFEPVIHDGVYLSEDYEFCRKWRAAGGTVWLDMGSKLSHTGMHTFNVFPGPEDRGEETALNCESQLT